MQHSALMIRRLIDGYEKQRWPIVVQILIRRGLEDVLSYPQDVFHTSNN